MRDRRRRRRTRFLTTGQPRGLRDASVAASSARSCVGASQFAGGLADEADGRRLLGLLPRPRSARAATSSRRSTTATHLADPARPRQRRARRSSTATPTRWHRRGLRQPPARRPLPRPLRLLRDAQVPPHAARSRGSRSGARAAPPSGWRAPTACRLDPGMNEEFDFQRLRHGPRRAGPVHGRAAPGRAPGRRRSPSGSTARRADARLLRRHRRLRRPRRGRGRGPTCCWPRRRSATAPTTRPTCTSPAPTAAATAPRPGVGAPGAHPRPAVARPSGRRGRGRAGCSTVRSTCARRGDVYEV